MLWEDEVGHLWGLQGMYSNGKERSDPAPDESEGPRTGCIESNDEPELELSEMEAAEVNEQVKVSHLAVDRGDASGRKELVCIQARVNMDGGPSKRFWWWNHQH